MKEATLKKTVSRTYSLKDGWYYKVQYELENKFDENEVKDLDFEIQYQMMSDLLHKELKQEKERLGL